MYKIIIILLIFLTSCSISTDSRLAYKAELFFLEQIFSKLNSEAKTDWYCLQYIDSSEYELHSFFMIDRKDFLFAFKTSTHREHIIYFDEILKPSQELFQIIGSDINNNEIANKKFKFTSKEDGILKVSKLSIYQMLSYNTLVTYLFNIERGFDPSDIYIKDNFFEQIIVKEAYEDLKPIYEKRY